MCRFVLYYYPDSKVHGANMGPTWVMSAPDGPHVGPMNLAIRVVFVLVDGCIQTDLLVQHMTLALPRLNISSVITWRVSLNDERSWLLHKGPLWMIYLHPNTSKLHCWVEPKNEEVNGILVWIRGSIEGVLSLYDILIIIFVRQCVAKMIWRAGHSLV